MRILILGTNDGNPAIFVGTTARITFDAATEAGAERPGLAGDLLLAEDGVAANGPRNRLPKVLIIHITKKADTVRMEMLVANSFRHVNFIVLSSYDC